MRFPIHIDKVGRLNGRARSFLGLLIIQHTLAGLALLAWPDRFTAESYVVIKRMAPLPVWGVAMLVVAFTAAVAFTVDVSKTARLAMGLSAFITAFWTTAFLLSGLGGALDTPLGPIFSGILAAKDYVVAGMVLDTIVTVDDAGVVHIKETPAPAGA